MDNNMYNQNNFNQQPPQNGFYPSYGSELEEPMSVKEWLICMLIMMIPCVNIVMMFVWAFGNGKKSKSNYFKASLIFAAIVLVLYLIIFFVFGLSFMNLANQNYY